MYQDEVHFQIQTTVTSGWYKKGSAPTVKSFPGRFKASYSGFVVPESGVLFTAKPEMFNYSTTVDSIRSFIDKHPVPKGKKYALVMDNAPWHKKTMRLVEQEAMPEYETSEIQWCLLNSRHTLQISIRSNRYGVLREGKTPIMSFFLRYHYWRKQWIQRLAYGQFRMIN